MFGRWGHDRPENILLRPHHWPTNKTQEMYVSLGQIAFYPGPVPLEQARLAALFVFDTDLAALDLLIDSSANRVWFATH